MTWFRVDDKFHSHVKPARAGLAAVGAWTLAGSWCGDHLTDGKIPREVAHKLAPKGVWEKLCQAGLVTPTGEGYELHDFLDWNPSAEAVKAERSRKSEAGRRGGLASGVSRTKAEAEPKQVLHQNEAGASRSVPEAPELPSRPVPSDPDPPVVPQGTDPPRTKGDRRKPARALPEGWAPGESHYGKAAKAGMGRPEVDRAAERFRMHHGAKGSVFADWGLAFHTWLANDLERRGPAQGAPDERPLSVRAEERRQREERNHGLDFDAIGRGGS